MVCNWLPTLCGWFKCNTDGVARVSLGHAAAGGIFRDYRGAILGCFSSYFGISIALHTELNAAVIAIEIAYQKGWLKLWLECDS